MNFSIVPKKIPQGYVLNQINVYKDYRFNALIFLPIMNTP